MTQNSVYYITVELILPHQLTCNYNLIAQALRYASLSSNRASQSLKRKDQIASMYYSYRINMNDVMITHDFEKMHMNAIAREHEQSKFDF